ncbi:hypothetical protein A7B51_07790 [Lentilactobacillus parabuchneri]|nr:hypothetical protein [Lentilactobacillus parabuchneri]OBU96862.1 hypothetical protein A7B51_07790 [Lentilactobacillus parabuchneri]
MHEITSFKCSTLTTNRKPSKKSITKFVSHKLIPMRTSFQYKGINENFQYIFKSGYKIPKFKFL